MTRQQQIEILWANYCASAGMSGKIDEGVPGTFKLWLREPDETEWQLTHFGSFLYLKGYITGRLEGYNTGRLDAEIQRQAK